MKRGDPVIVIGDGKPGRRKAGTEPPQAHGVVVKLNGSNLIVQVGDTRRFVHRINVRPIASEAPGG